VKKGRNQLEKEGGLLCIGIITTVHRYHNHSHFEYPKGAAHPSDYSTVRCLSCGAIGRTKAKYVDFLKDDPEAW